ncbi:MAG TPA: hypothetical protein VGL56_11070 [Fimbriimonadaceae bacterium]|jgi:hypothetical protein
MLKTLSVLALAALCATCAFATNTISGSMGWVSGTATATITPSTTPQTIVIKVGTTNTTYKSIYVVGDPNNDIIYSGSPVELMVAGSQPFAATYSAGATISAMTSDGLATARRAVPVSTTGVIQYGIAFNAGTLQIQTPNCNIAGVYLFYGGVDMSFELPLPKYSVTLPTGNASVGVSTIAYPTTTLPENLFDFEATGESTIELFGESSSSSVYVSGRMIGPVATFTGAVLVIYSHFEN